MGFFGYVVHVVGVDAYRGVDPVVLFGEGDGCVEVVRAGSAAYGQQGLHACFARSCEHCVAVFVKLRKLEVRVGIDNFHLGDPGYRQLRYFRRAPTGTSSVKVQSTGLPSGVEAATIIPLDSTPRSLRGARFATITTLRPTSSSGW